MRFRQRLVVLLTVVLACVGTGVLHAQSSNVGELVRKLKESQDFRVRTQAALALGATASSSAVEPLCAALADTNTTVRAASAAALGRLALGGRQCIEKSLAGETNPEVQEVLKRALSRLAPKAPTFGPAAKFYVSVGDVTNQTKQSPVELNRAIRSALSKHFAQIASFAVAPEGETSEQATQVLAKHPGVGGIYVWPKVSANYAQGSLTLKVELSLFSYPGKAYKGSMSKNLTMPDVPKFDPAAENELLEMALERLAPDLERNASRL